MRLTMLPLAFVTTAAAPIAAPMQSPGNIRDLSQAVASVNDWRAILLFVIFVMVAQMIGSAWQRYLDRRALERLGASIERLADQVATSTTASLLHQARVESFLARLDHDR